MAGWGGFSEEDLHQLKKDQVTEPKGKELPEEKPGDIRKVNINPGPKRTKPREKIKTRTAASKKNFNEKPSANETQCLKEKSGESMKNFSEFEVENSTPEFDRNMVDTKVEESSKTQKELDVGNVNDSAENVPDIILEPERIQAIELSALQKMQQKQKEIEDQNKLKKAAIQETIKTRFKKTKAEAQVLKVVQQEVAHLDSLLSADVAILRDTIEEATRDYHYAMKRYEQAEAEFVAAKLELHRKSERKELLTEHLYAIIQQNEERKAKKLEELMAKLNLSDCEIQVGEKSTDQSGNKMTYKTNESEVKTLKVNEKEDICRIDGKFTEDVQDGCEKQVLSEVKVGETRNETTEVDDMEKMG